MTQHDDHQRPDRDTANSRGDALVVFGLTGDLGRSKLLPALWELHAAGRLDIPVVGVGRNHPGDEQLRELLRQSLSAEEAEQLGVDPDGDAPDIDLGFVAGDVADTDTWAELAEILDDRSAVVYAALPPDLLATVAARMADSELAAARLVVEKPFGHDADSATQLHREIDRHIGADRLFLVDHFLAKASVELMTAARRRNPLLAVALAAPHVTRVEIDFPEAGGVDGRGRFYDSVGVVADVVQNHLLQTMTLALMDPPASGDADAVAEARRDLLRRVRPLTPDEVVLGQYDGYRDVDDVATDSTTATAFAGRFRVDHPAWRDVPITIRTGKRLPDPGLRVSFRVSLPTRRDGEDDADVNVVRFVHGDDPRLELDLHAPDVDGTDPVTTALDLPTGHGPLHAYATMLDSALDGDPTHFTEIDDVVEAWRIVEPILGADRPAVAVYDPADAPTTEHGPFPDAPG